MFGNKTNAKPQSIDSLIGAGTVIEGNISFTGGLRIDGAASLGSRAWPLHKAQPPSEPFNGFHRAYLPDVLKAEQ